jgi:MinD-like ATPase involved in chromosome partitioning or flagellar assembly
MTARKHLGRGLESVSHLFLSRRPESPPNGSPPQDEPSPHEVQARTPGVPTPFLFVASGSDVIGKSVVACNVALELARRGHTTALVDADRSMPTCRLLMGGLAEREPGRQAPAVEALDRLRLFETADQAVAAGPWDYVVVNAPAGPQPSNGSPSAMARVLLVISPEAAQLIRSYALVKRIAGWHPGVQLGIVVSGVAHESAARALFDQFLDVLGRRLNVLPAYCGCLAEHEGLSRSVLQRVPAVLTPEHSALAEQLRAIAAAVACEFEPGASPGGSARNR